VLPTASDSVVDIRSHSAYRRDEDRHHNWISLKLFERPDANVLFTSAPLSRFALAQTDASFGVSRHYRAIDVYSEVFTMLR
jgi:hypothetical protein